MLFPIGDDNVTRGHKPFITYLFIAINCVVFLYEFFLPETQQSNFINTYGAIPQEIKNGKDYFTLITSIFLHGGWMHLIGNMLFLWIFADNIEATIGSYKFILFYVAGGIVASIVHTYIAPNSQVPCVGASGSISACLGAYVLMFPKSKIKILVLVIFSTFRVSALLFLGIWIIQQLFAGFGSLAVSTSNTQEGGVAYWAHIGGFVFGILAGWYFIKNKPVPIT
jgi:membrane associated rhomboid family serine protease